MSKYTGDFNYKGELKRISTDKDLRMSKYEYVLNGRKYHIVSKPWMNIYGHWEARSGGGFWTSANNLWRVVANIDRSEQNGT